MNIPENLKYTKSHEWVSDAGNGKVKVGITDHAQQELGDLVFIELPQQGDSFNQGDGLAVVESVKATSDIMAPVTGVVTGVNETLTDTPEAVNEDCYGAWLVEMEGVAEGLLSAEEYRAFLQEEA
ncbi:MAG TPA: glycine cleavage system protein GcvH [Clostridiales bacterium]|nr:glycine cleavage system protein GcvH [Clostridiales bacterium]